MKTVRRVYSLDGKEYEVAITHRHTHAVRLYYGEKNGYRVSAPLFYPTKEIDRFVFKALPKIIGKVAKKPSYYDGQRLYVFGKRIEVGEMEEGEAASYYKKVGLPYLKQRVAYFEGLMGVHPPYAVTMRRSTNTFGSNSRKTHRLSFQAALIAYSPDVIDSVVVHELAHHFHFDHSPKFYEVVYRYCPDYDKCRKKLIHHVYAE